MLTLSEKLLLLGLHDEKGSVVFSASTALPYGLAGALLLELYLTGTIAISDNKVKLLQRGHSDNDLLSETIALIDASEKQRSIKHWLNAIHSKVKKIQPRLAEQLVQKKVLDKQEHTFLWVFNYNRYPTHDSQPELDVRAHIKDIVLNGKQANHEDVALLGLIKACELINEVFDRDERKHAKANITSLTKDEKIGKIIGQIIDEIMTALLIIIMAASVSSSASS